VIASFLWHWCPVGKRLLVRWILGFGSRASRPKEVRRLRKYCRVDQTWRVSGFFAARAGLPPLPDAPRVRWLQQRQRGPALRWAARELELPLRVQLKRRVRPRQ